MSMRGSVRANPFNRVSRTPPREGNLAGFRRPNSVLCGVARAVTGLLAFPVGLLAAGDESLHVVTVGEEHFAGAGAEVW